MVIFREFVEVERGEQDEFERACLRSHRVGDLQHRYSGQPAEHRLHRDDALLGLDLFEIAAVVQIEGAVGPQRVAKQAAVRIDGQDPSELRVLFAHVRQKRRTCRLVTRVEIAGARQSIVELGGALNLLVQIIGDLVGGRRQIGQRCVDLAGAVLHETQADEDRRHQHGRDDEDQ